MAMGNMVQDLVFGKASRQAKMGGGPKLLPTPESSDHGPGGVAEDSKASTPTARYDSNSSAQSFSMRSVQRSLQMATATFAF